VTEATPSSALDQSTFDRRFAEVRERVHRICIGLVGRDSAEDVVHDVYLRARSRQAQLRNPEQFDAWICRAAINLCFNRQRAQTRMLDRLPTFAARQQDQPEPDLGPRPPAAVHLPSASASASVGQSEGPSVSPSASPTPTSSPSLPPPIASDVDPHLVGPFSSCSDGTVGFSVFLPDGWYANRRIGDSPACQTVGHVRNVEGSQVLDPEIYLNVQPDPPAFSDAEIEEQEEILLTNGIALQRYVTSIAESGAVAASRGVTYIAPLLKVEAGGPGGYLVAATDANNEDSVAGLDALMERLELHESLTADATAVAAARDLFTDRDVCLDAERGLGVVFPDAWWTNTAVNDLPACSYFAPEFFELGEPGTVPDEVDISITVFDGGYGRFNEIVGTETLTLMGRPVTRWELAAADGRTYQYVVLLGEIPGGLHARWTGGRLRACQGRARRDDGTAHLRGRATWSEL